MPLLYSLTHLPNTADYANLLLDKATTLSGISCCSMYSLFTTCFVEGSHQPVCNKCHIRGNDHKKCAGCKQVLYCSRECQKSDWNAGHKQMCPVSKFPVSLSFNENLHHKAIEAEKGANTKDVN